MSWTSSSVMTPTFLALIMMEKVKIFMLVRGQLEPPLTRGPLPFKNLFFFLIVKALYMYCWLDKTKSVLKGKE